MLFETTYNLYTTDDKSAGKFAVDSDEDAPEDNSYDAANPSMVMATQLQHELPPIDDVDFMPKNPKELARAAQAMMDIVSDDQVEFVYRNLQRLVTQADDRAKELEVYDPVLDDVTKLAAPVDAKEKSSEDQ